MGVHGYGVVALAAGVVLYLSQVADFALETQGIREVALRQGDVGTLAPAILSVRIALAAVLVVVTICASLLLLPGPEAGVIAVYALTLLPVAAGTKWIHLGLETARAAGVSMAVAQGTMLLVVLLLVRDIGDITYVPLGQFVGECLGAGVLAWWLLRRGHRLALRWDREAAEPIFRRAAPLVGHSLLGLFIFNADLIFLRFFRDAESVGYYAAAYTLISFLLNLGVTYGMTLLPTLTRMGPGTEEESGLYHHAMALVFAVGLPIALGGALLADGIVGQIFGTSYRPSGVALAILIWSIPASLFRNVGVTLLVARGRTDMVFRTTVWAAGLNLVLNAALIPGFGIAGAAVATLATEILRTALALKYVSAQGVVPIAPGRLWRPAAAGLAMAGALWWAGLGSIWLAVPAGAIIYTVALVPLGVVRFGEGGLPTVEV